VPGAIPPAGAAEPSRARQRGVTPSPAAAPEQSTLARLGPWITIGAGTLLFAGGVVAGVRAKRADEDFKDACPTLRACDPKLESTQRDVERYSHLSAGLLAAGGLLVTGGIVWRVLTPAAQPANAGSAAGAWFVSANGRF
jgi:hypothetical protein